MTIAITGSLFGDASIPVYLEDNGQLNISHIRSHQEIATVARSEDGECTEGLARYEQGYYLDIRRAETQPLTYAIHARVVYFNDDPTTAIGQRCPPCGSINLYPYNEGCKTLA